MTETMKHAIGSMKVALAALSSEIENAEGSDYYRSEARDSVTWIGNSLATLEEELHQINEPSS